MEIRGQCPACQAKYKVAEKYAGKTLRCPKCQAAIEVPRQDAKSISAAPVEGAPAHPPPPMSPAPAPKPAIGPLSEIKIDTSARMPRGKAVVAAPKPKVQRNKNLPVVLALAGGCVALAVLAVVVVAITTRSPESKQTRSVAQSKAPPRQAKPSLPQLPAQPVPQQEPVSRPIPEPTPVAEVPMPPVVEVKAADPIPGFEGWQQILADARQQAATEKKDIVIAFGCSDSQPATQQLAAALKEPAAEEALKEMVRVVIDFPRSREGAQLVQDRAQNRRLWDEFALIRLPALALADAEGRTYWLVQHWTDGYDELGTKLAEWQKRKAERDQLLANANTGSAEEQLAAAAKAIDWLQEHDLWRFYQAEIDAWAILARQADPDNKKGIFEAFFEPQWYLHAAAIRIEDGNAAKQVVAELDPWIKRRFQDPDRGAKLHLVAAKMLQTARQFDDATKQMEHAVGYRPLDGTLVEALRGVRQILENRDVLASGTGFLISTAGFVLTNEHVIAGQGKIIVRVPGVKEPVVAELVAQDRVADIALIKVKLPTPERYKPLALSSRGSRRGASVAGFGYPLGDTLGAGLKFSAGVISAVPDELSNRYLLDLTVNPGSSGGPLCDRRGNVVGMISEKTGSGDFEDSYGLAIPAAELSKFLDQHLPAGALRAVADTANTELPWDKVDERVSSGVMMIVKKK